MPRFAAVPHGNEAWKVIDHEAEHFNMPPLAVSLYLYEKEAKEIAQILNNVWARFQANPS